MQGAALHRVGISSQGGVGCTSTTAGTMRMPRGAAREVYRGEMPARSTERAAALERAGATAAAPAAAARATAAVSLKVTTRKPGGASKRKESRRPPGVRGDAGDSGALKACLAVRVGARRLAKSAPPTSTAATATAATAMPAMAPADSVAGAEDAGGRSAASMLQLVVVPSPHAAEYAPTITDAPAAVVFGESTAVVTLAMPGKAARASAGWAKTAMRVVALLSMVTALAAMPMACAAASRAAHSAAAGGGAGVKTSGQETTMVVGAEASGGAAALGEADDEGEREREPEGLTLRVTDTVGG